MSRVALANIFRFVLLYFIQVLVLRNVSLNPEGSNYIHLYIYPLFLALLPLRMAHWSLLLIGFGTGLAVDAFYGAWGLHTAASVFTGYIRPYLVRIFEPTNGYTAKGKVGFNALGMGWYVRYTGALLLLHLLFYFSVEAFSIYYLSEILIRTVLSFAVSMVLVVMYKLIADP